MNCNIQLIHDYQGGAIILIWMEDLIIILYAAAFWIAQNYEIQIFLFSVNIFQPEHYFS